MLACPLSSDAERTFSTPSPLDIVSELTSSASVGPRSNQQDRARIHIEEMYTCSIVSGDFIAFCTIILRLRWPNRLLGRPPNNIGCCSYEDTHRVLLFLPVSKYVCRETEVEWQHVLDERNVLM